METFFQKPQEGWTDIEKRAFAEIQNICNRHNGDAEARYGAWEAMVWLSSQLPEEKFVGDHETFAEHYGCLLDPPQEPAPVIVGAASYESLSDILAIGFMDYLDRNRAEGKMCLSGWECDDIMKAFRKQDWERIERYRDKYLLSKNN